MDTWKTIRLSAFLAAAAALLVAGLVGWARQRMDEESRLALERRGIYPDPWGGYPGLPANEPPRSPDPFVVMRPQVEARTRELEFDRLIDLITSTEAPTTWDEVGGPGSIAGFDTNLHLGGGQRIVNDSEPAPGEMPAPTSEVR